MAVLLLNNSKAFHQFLEFCKRCTENDGEVIKLLEKRYKKTCQTYLSSAEFGSMIVNTTEKIRTDLKHKFVYIKEFITELKAYGPKTTSKRTIDHNPLETSSKKTKTDENHESDSGGDNPSDDLPSHGSSVSNNVNKAEESAENKSVSDSDGENIAYKFSTAVQAFAGSLGLSTKGAAVKRRLSLNKSSTTGFGQAFSCQEIPKSKDRVKALKSISSTKFLDTTPESSDAEKGNKASERQIRKLEVMLGSIDREIKKLEELEMDLDDLAQASSKYILLDKYKAKFVKVWNKLCQVKGRDTSTGRPMERRFKFEGTRYPEINRKIEKFINKHRIFPDYHDVRQILSYCNKKYKLCLGKKMLEGLAKDVFSDVGNKLQERRQEDLVADFGCHLTDKYKAYDDPAMYDRELRKKLEENKCLSKSRLEEVINKFAEKQMRGADSDSESDEEDDDYHKDDDSTKAMTPIREPNPEDYDSTPEFLLDDYDEDENDQAKDDDEPAEKEECDILELVASGKKRRDNFRQIFTDNSPSISDCELQTPNVGSPSSQSNIITLDTEGSDSDYCGHKVGYKGLTVVEEENSSDWSTPSPKQQKEAVETGAEIEDAKSEETLAQSEEELNLHSETESKNEVKSDLEDADMEIILMKESDSKETPKQSCKFNFVDELRQEVDFVNESKKEIVSVDDSKQEVDLHSVDEFKQEIDLCSVDESKQGLITDSVDTDLEIIFVKETNSKTKMKKKPQSDKCKATNIDKHELKSDAVDTDLEIIEPKESVGYTNIDSKTKCVDKPRLKLKNKFSIVLNIKPAIMGIKVPHKATVKTSKKENKMYSEKRSEKEQSLECDAVKSNLKLKKVDEWKSKLKSCPMRDFEFKVGPAYVGGSKSEVKKNTVHKPVRRVKTVLVTEISSDDSSSTSSSNSSDDCIVRSVEEKGKYSKESQQGMPKNGKRKLSRKFPIYGLDDAVSDSSDDNCSVISLPPPKRLKHDWDEVHSGHSSLPSTPLQSPTELTVRARSSPELRLSQESHMSSGSLQLEICNIRSLYDSDKIWSVDNVCADYVEAAKYVSPSKITSSLMSDNIANLSPRCEDAPNRAALEMQADNAGENDKDIPVNQVTKEQPPPIEECSTDKELQAVVGSNQTVTDLIPPCSQETGDYLSHNECSHPSSFNEPERGSIDSFAVSSELPEKAKVSTLPSVESADMLINLDAESSRDSNESVEKELLNIDDCVTVDEPKNNDGADIPSTLVENTTTVNSSKKEADPSNVAKENCALIVNQSENISGNDYLPKPVVADSGIVVNSPSNTQNIASAEGEQVLDFVHLEPAHEKVDEKGDQTSFESLDLSCESIPMDIDGGQLSTSDGVSDEDEASKVMKCDEQTSANNLDTLPEASVTLNEKMDNAKQEAPSVDHSPCAIDNAPEKMSGETFEKSSHSPVPIQQQSVSATSTKKPKLFSPTKLKLSLDAVKKASVVLKASLFKLGHSATQGHTVTSADVDPSSLPTVVEDVQLVPTEEPMECLEPTECEESLMSDSDPKERIQVMESLLVSLETCSDKENVTKGDETIVSDCASTSEDQIKRGDSSSSGGHDEHVNKNVSSSICAQNKFPGKKPESAETCSDKSADEPSSVSIVDAHHEGLSFRDSTKRENPSQVSNSATVVNQSVSSSSLPKSLSAKPESKSLLQTSSSSSHSKSSSTKQHSTLYHSSSSNADSVGNTPHPSTSSSRPSGKLLTSSSFSSPGNKQLSGSPHSTNSKDNPSVDTVHQDSSLNSSDKTSVSDISASCETSSLNSKVSSDQKHTCSSKDSEKDPDNALKKTSGSTSSHVGQMDQSDESLANTSTNSSSSHVDEKDHHTPSKEVSKNTSSESLSSPNFDQKLDCDPSEEALDKKSPRGSSFKHVDKTCPTSPSSSKGISKAVPANVSSPDAKSGMDHDTNNSPSQSSNVQNTSASSSSSAASSSSKECKSFSHSSPKLSEPTDDIIFIDDSESSSAGSHPKKVKAHHHGSGKSSSKKPTNDDHTSVKSDITSIKGPMLGQGDGRQTGGSKGELAKKSVNKQSTSSVPGKENVCADSEDVTIIDVDDIVSDGSKVSSKVKRKGDHSKKHSVVDEGDTTQGKSDPVASIDNEKDDSDDSILITQVEAGMKRKKKYVIRAEKPHLQPNRRPEIRTSQMPNQHRQNMGSMQGGFDLTSICKSVVSKVVKEGNKGATPPPNISSPVVIMPNGTKISANPHAQQMKRVPVTVAGARVMTGRHKGVAPIQVSVPSLVSMPCPTSNTGLSGASRFQSIAPRPGNTGLVKSTYGRFSAPTNAIQGPNARPGVRGQNSQFSSRTSQSITTGSQHNPPIIGLQRSPRKMFMPRPVFTSTPTRGPRPSVGYTQQRPVKSVQGVGTGVRNQNVTGLYKTSQQMVPRGTSRVTVRNDMSQFKVQRQQSNYRQQAQYSGGKTPMQHRQTVQSLAPGGTLSTSKIANHHQVQRTSTVMSNTSVVRKKRRNGSKSGEVIVLSDSD